MKKQTKHLALAAAIALPMMAWASPGHDGGQGDKHGHAHGADHASAAGMAGDPAKADRTVEVQLNDTMRFTPDVIKAKAGETIRFKVVNKGKLPHEMVIGTKEELDAHAQMMRKMPGMKHEDANQVTLNAGQSGEIVWTFGEAGSYAFACLIPGHREAGMVGQLSVTP